MGRRLLKRTRLTDALSVVRKRGGREEERGGREKEREGGERKREEGERERERHREREVLSVILGSGMMNSSIITAAKTKTASCHT